MVWTHAVVFLDSDGAELALCKARADGDAWIMKRPDDTVVRTACAVKVMRLDGTVVAQSLTQVGLAEFAAGLARRLNLEAPPELTPGPGATGAGSLQGGASP